MWSCRLYNVQDSRAHKPYCRASELLWRVVLGGATRLCCGPDWTLCTGTCYSRYPTKCGVWCVAACCILSASADGVVACRMERICPEEGGRPFSRPVVRIPELGLVFSRIIADRPHTSMIMHVRPGWTSLYDSLCPTSPDGITGYVANARATNIFVLQMLSNAVCTTVVCTSTSFARWLSYTAHNLLRDGS